MLALALLTGVFFTSLCITGLTRRYALRKGLYDFPNARSSHTLATPRGGGLAIALSFFAALVLLEWGNFLPTHIAWVLLGGGGLIAFAGWRDDHAHVAAGWRILIHTMAALWAIYWLYDIKLAELNFLTGLKLSITVLAVVWLTNLYNFMDGIDGLAGSEAVFAGLSGGVLLWLNGAHGLALTSFCLATASAGFLIWNWPPAKIFMGDVGSGLLGFSFAVLIIASHHSETLIMPVWVILLAFFILDASYTLVWRMLRSESWLQAHRSHAYQRLVQLGASHRQVTRWVILINCVLLFPLACLTAWQPGSWPWILGIVLLGSGLTWFAIQHKFHRHSKTVGES